MGQGKKSKAKARLDKYWTLAHQEGFRARSAYKLTQLNKKYGFLNRSSTVVDLCAAPGGWLQVCQQTMPVTSTIVGVDLFPIKPIPGVKSLIGDITTDKTKKELLRELGGKKAEVVLHDGAPSVGGTWDKDAYVQNVLVLHAARFACSVLQPDGVFVTKVFRSADYTKILWVLESHFDKVEATKPPSSRNQSAEIFVVCRGYKAPKTLDLKFFNPQHVFSEIEEKDKEIRVGMEHGDQGGYENEISVGGMRLHGEMPVHMFVRHPNPETIVETYGAITFRAEEDQQFAKSKHTTLEIQECCADIKSLNKTDKTRLLKWRRSLWEQYRQVRSKERLERGLANPDYEDEDGKGSGSEGDEEGDEGAADTGDKSDEDPMLVKMQRELDALRKQKAKQIKKKERKTVNSALQRAQRTNFNPDDNPLEVIAKQDGELFKQPGDGLVQERKLDAGDMDVDHISLASGSDADAMSIGSQSDLDSLGGESDLDSGPEGEEPRESNYYERLERILDNTFKEEKYERVGHREEVDPADPAPFVEVARGKGLANRQEGEWLDSEDSMSDTTVGGDSDDSLDDRPRKKRRNDDGEGRVSKSHKKIGFEEVPKMLRDPENRAKVLAIGTKMLDKKSKRDIMEAGWNRFSYNDDGLPKWFVEDEQKHVFVQLPVTKEEVQGERARYKEINARPARKVLEAMHRKYQKAKRAVGKIADKAKAAGGETLKNKSVPSVRDVIRSKDMRNSHKAKKPIDPKTLGDKKRERLKIAKQGRGKRKRFH